MDDFSMLEKLIFLKAANGVPLHEYTATGNPVKFETNKAKPLLKLLASWTPTQSGTGDPSPSNVRPVVGLDGVNVTHCGQNLFDFTQTPTEVDCFSVSGASLKRNGFVIHLPSGVYTFSGEIHKSCYIYCNVLNANGTWVSTLQFMSTTVVSQSTVTLSDGQYIVVFDAQQDSNKFGNVDIMLTIGSIASEYEPYSGTSYSVAFPATGKNLLTGTPYVGQFFNVGAGVDLKKTSTHASFTESGNEITITTDVTWYGCIFATGLLSPGTYNVHTETSDESCRFSIYVTDADLITKERKAVTSNNINVTLTESSRIAVTINNQTTGSVVATNVQVESGSSYTSWEPYTATVYGGTLDLTTGVLTAEYKLFNIKDTVKADWTYYANARGYYFSADKYGMKSGNYANDPACVCNQYPKVNSWANDGIKIGNNNYVVFFCGVDSDYATIDDWVEYIATADIELTFPLATPVTYQLTPQQISALIGNNTMWASADNLSMTYLKKG